MKQKPFPKLEGHIEIANEDDRIVIAGDPKGLKSFANILSFLAETDQESIPNMPDGERYHTHLFPGVQISVDSKEIEICRLDAKGTKEFPKHYKKGSFE